MLREVVFRRQKSAGDFFLKFLGIWLCPKGHGLFLCPKGSDTDYRESFWFGDAGKEGISSCRQKGGTMPDTHDLRFVANQPNQQIGGKYHGRKNIHIL